MRKHKLLAVLLALAMTISLLPTAAAAESGYRDTDGHWAETAIDRWSGYGIIQGNDGAFNPNGALTRAHMAAILTRLLGLPAADSAGFTDVDEGAWYAEYINRCAAAGIMLGAGGKASPNALITRQQAMVMLARALGIQPVKNPDLSAYKDGGAVSEYARGYVAAMIEAGIVGGVSADTLGCGSNITRAATVTILDRAITTYANRPDSRVEAVSGGIVLVAADGVELTGSADSVLVTQGAADGTVTLDGVTADSVLVLAENSTVVLDGNSKAETVTVSETAEGAEVVVEEDAKVTTVVTEAPESKVSVSGRVGDVVTAESAREAAVEVAKGGRVEEITAAGEKTDIAVSGKVENVTVEESAEDTTVEAGTGGVISKVDNAAEGTTVSGKGKVESVTTSGDNTTVTTKGTEVEVEKGTTGTTAGGKDVSGGTTVTTPGSSGGSSSGGSSSGGGSSHSHRYTYQDNGDGTHTGTCSCGEKTSPEAHKVDDTGVCTVCGADGFVARIGTTGYKNLQDALNVGGDVVLVKDVIEPETTFHVKDGKNVVLNLNGKTLSGGGYDAALQVSGGAKLTINGDGNVIGNDQNRYGMAVWAVDEGSLVVINGGNYSNVMNHEGDTQLDMIYVSEGGDAEINGGTFKCATPKWTLNIKDGNYSDGSSTIVVKGGTFYQYDPSHAVNENPVADFVPDGYFSVQDGEWYVVSDAKNLNGVTVKGIAGYENMVFGSLDAALTEIRPEVEKLAGLGENTCSAEQFDAFYNDGGQITWTIYGEHVLTDPRTFSFGRTASYYGAKSLTKINVVAGNSEATIDLNQTSGTFSLPYNWWGDTVKNIEIYFDGITFDGIESIPGTWATPSQDTPYIFENCTFNGKIYGYHDYNVNLTIRDSVFNAPDNVGYAIMLQSATGIGGKVVLDNNVFNGYTRGINMERNGTEFIVTNNTIKSTVQEPDRGAIQITDGKSFVVTGNTIDVNGGNAFWFHSAAKNSDVVYTIDDNDITAPYLANDDTNFGVNEKITSSGNIFNSTDIVNCMEKEGTAATPSTVTAIR